MHSELGVLLVIALEHLVWGFCCTNPCEQLSGEIFTDLVPQCGLGDERLLHTILVSDHLHLKPQKVAGCTVLVFPARAHHYVEGGSIHLIQRAWGHSDIWVLFVGA